MPNAQPMPTSRPPSSWTTWHISACQVAPDRANSLQDLRTWTVGGVRGSTSLKKARENRLLIPDQILVEEVNSATLVRKLQAGRYGSQGAIIGGEAVLRHEAKIIGLELSAVWTLERQQFMTAFSRQNVDAQTLNAFFRTLDAMKKSGATRELLLPYGLTAAP